MDLTTHSSSLRRRANWLAVIAGGLLASHLAVGSPSTGAESGLVSLNQSGTVESNLCFDSGTFASICEGAHAFLSGSTLNYTASSQADYGLLRASAASSIFRPAGSPSSGGPFGFGTWAGAWFQDEWILTGQPNGAPGTLTLGFALSGTYMTLPNTYAYYSLAMYDVDSLAVDDVGHLPLQPAFLSLDFAFGVPLNFLVELIVFSDLISLESGGYDGQASFMNLSQTALISSIGVTDPNGTPLSYQLTTASGEPRFEALAAPDVPEPSGLILTMMGLGILPLVRRKE